MTTSPPPADTTRCSASTSASARDANSRGRPVAHSTSQLPLVGRTRTTSGRALPRMPETVRRKPCRLRCVRQRSDQWGHRPSSREQAGETRRAARASRARSAIVSVVGANSGLSACVKSTEESARPRTETAPSVSRISASSSRESRAARTAPRWMGTRADLVGERAADATASRAERASARRVRGERS